MGLIGKRSTNDGKISIAPNLNTGISIETSGGGSGGRPITFATAQFGNSTINKRQRRHSLSDKKAIENDKDEPTTSQPSNVSSIQNQQTSRRDPFQVYLSGQQELSTAFGNGSTKNNEILLKGARPILPNNQQQQQQQHMTSNPPWMQTQSNIAPLVHTSNPMRFSGLTPDQLQQLILMQQAAVSNSTNENSS
jgi:hypothetical protein